MGIDNGARIVYVHYAERGREQSRTRAVSKRRRGSRASAELVGVLLCLPIAGRVWNETLLRASHECHVILTPQAKEPALPIGSGPTRESLPAQDDTRWERRCECVLVTEIQEQVRDVSPYSATSRDAPGLSGSGIVSTKKFSRSSSSSTSSTSTVLSMVFQVECRSGSRAVVSMVSVGSIASGRFGSVIVSSSTATLAESM